MNLSKKEKLVLSIVRVAGGKENVAQLDRYAWAALTKQTISQSYKTCCDLVVRGLLAQPNETSYSVTKEGLANLLPKEQLVELHAELKVAKTKKKAPKKAPAKKKVVVKKAATKKAPVKKVLTKKAAAKKAPAKKTAVKKTVVKPPTVDTSTNKRQHRKSSIVQYDVALPSEGTKSRAVWDTLNKFKSKKRRAPTRQEAQAMNPNAGASLVGVCLANWNRFNG